MLTSCLCCCKVGCWNGTVAVCRMLPPAAGGHQPGATPQSSSRTGLHGMAVLCHFQADNGAIRGLAWLPSQVGWPHHTSTVLHALLSMSPSAGALCGRMRSDCSLMGNAQTWDAPKSGYECSVVAPLQCSTTQHHNFHLRSAIGCSICGSQH